MRVLVALCALLIAVPASAAQVSDAWSPPSLVGSSTGIAYLTLTSDADDALVAVTSPAAKTIELHTHRKDNGVLRMRKLETIPLPAGTPVTLAPRGHHLMLYSLTTPLKEGATFPVTLQFRDAKPVTVTVQVSQQKLLDFLRR